MRAIGFIRRAGMAVGLSFMLAGCASQVTSEVTRYHRVGPPEGETIAILPADSKLKGSLEFARFAGLVASKLTAVGYTVVSSGKYQLVARLGYSVGAGETRIKSWSGNYVHYHFYYGHHHPYYLGLSWDEPSIYAYVVYPRQLNLDILRSSDGTVLFEGKVKSYGTEDNLSQVMPYLVEAMFQNFPGESGVTRRVTISKHGNSQPW